MRYTLMKVERSSNALKTLLDLWSDVLLVNIVLFSKILSSHQLHVDLYNQKAAEKA